jgi:hypothetical protein
MDFEDGCEVIHTFLQTVASISVWAEKAPILGAMHPTTEVALRAVRQKIKREVGILRNLESRFEEGYLRRKMQRRH